VDTDEWAKRGSSFGAVAAEYAEFRPDYPVDAVRWCVAPVGRDIGSLRLLDLGAGTGKLTALLTALGADVTAVEPDQAMLGELRRALPSVRALPGSAEQIPLADASVDAVLCGQSLHWFNLERALPEIARVLVPGGTLAGLWNSDDDRVAWVAGLQKAAEGAASPSLSRRRQEAASFSTEQFAGARSGAGQSGAGQSGAGQSGAVQSGAVQSGAVQSGAVLFSPAERAEFANAQLLTADRLVAVIGTHSQILVMEPGPRASLLARIRAYLTSRPETAEGEFELPMVTSVIRAVRQG
jgi:SAM-dependent methyltransferase